MKERIDKSLVDRGYFDTRERAKKNIMAGKVVVNNFVVDKPGHIVSANDIITIKEDSIPYVSRGGLKLEKAISLWGIDLRDKICMDIGASTGGFTDAMLQNFSSRVYSVDVGYGQLDWKLRNDPRVVNLERTNIRHLKSEEIPDKIDFFSVDVSFISLKLIFPKLKELGGDRFECVALIKPQFEVGRSEVGKNGVVRDPKSHEKAIRLAIQYAQESNLFVRALDYSPIKGPKGNIEYLLYITNAENDLELPDIHKTVAESHYSLKKKES